jgi:hypothetical protein
MGGGILISIVDRDKECSNTRIARLRKITLVYEVMMVVSSTPCHEKFIFLPP